MKTLFNNYFSYQSSLVMTMFEKNKYVGIAVYITLFALAITSIWYTLECHILYYAITTIVGTIIHKVYNPKYYRLTGDDYHTTNVKDTYTWVFALIFNGVSTLCSYTIYSFLF